MLQNATKMLQENRQICPCGKAYKHRPSLTRHKKKCTYTVVKPMECEKAAHTDEKAAHADEKAAHADEKAAHADEKAAHADEKKVLVILNTIMKDNQSILKENRELRKEIKNIKINNITNNNNQKYNINVFLNEHCKDAMCLEDFISNLHVTLQDVMKTAQDGFVGGVSNILIKNLNDLSALKRPIHCSDLKRQKFYVKDKEGWSVDASNQKVDKVIDDVAVRQFTKINDWTSVNPDYLTNDVKLKEWQTMVHKLSGSSDKKDTNIIKKNMGQNTGIKDAMMAVD